MNQYTWSDKMGARQRRAWLILIKNGEIYQFEGVTIPKVITVVGHDYSKNGKWSHTTYRLALGEGVRPISGMMGWETGRFTEGLAQELRIPTPDTWDQLAKALDVGIVTTKEWLRNFAAKEAEALDGVDKALDELEGDEGNAGSSIVKVEFGSPTNRQRSEGFWTTPKPIPGGGELYLLKEGDWVLGNIGVRDREGRVLSVVRSGGRNGGDVLVKVAVKGGSDDGTV